MSENNERQQARQQFRIHEAKRAEHLERSVEERRKADAHGQIARGLLALWPGLDEADEETVPEPEAEEPTTEVDTPRLEAEAAVHADVVPSTVAEPEPVAGGNTRQDHPRGVDALRGTMGQHPGHYFTVDQIREMHETKGWLSPDLVDEAAVIRAALNRAVRMGAVDKKPLNGRSMSYAWVEGIVVAGGNPVREVRNGQGGLVLMDPTPFRMTPDRFVGGGDA